MPVPLLIDLFSSILSLLFDEGSVEYFNWEVIRRQMDLLINQKLD
jgi:hypothetical protein